MLHVRVDGSRQGPRNARGGHQTAGSKRPDYGGDGRYVRGVGGAAIKQSLREFVLGELADSYQLLEKLSALGGRVVIDTPAIDVSTDAGSALRSLLEHEVATVSALHGVILHSGQEARSEALEHLLEHVIMRKQQQIDYLWHASSLEGPLGAGDS
jgi:hypothetical protein